jgi:hypothetical protein
MYGEKAYNNPPAKAAGHHRAQRRSTKNMEMPDSAKPSRKTRLRAAVGPLSHVTGANTIPNNGAPVLLIRFTPWG